MRYATGKLLIDGVSLNVGPFAQSIERVVENFGTYEAIDFINCRAEQRGGGILAFTPEQVAAAPAVVSEVRASERYAEALKRLRSTVEAFNRKAMAGKILVERFGSLEEAVLALVNGTASPAPKRKGKGKGVDA